MLLTLLLVLSVQVQTVPGNITKVSRGTVDLTLCQDERTETTLTAGAAYDAVFLVDGMRYEWSAPNNAARVTHRYQVLRIWLAPASGAHLSRDATVDDTGPLCPEGTAHAGHRPHLIPLPALSAGTYRVFGMALDRRKPDGTMLEPALVARIPETTPMVTVTVK